MALPLAQAPGFSLCTEPNLTLNTGLIRRSIVEKIQPSVEIQEWFYQVLICVCVAAKLEEVEQAVCLLCHGVYFFPEELSSLFDRF